MQLSFLPTPEITFNLYHDESGTYAPHALNSGDRWLLHGVLLIPEQVQPQLIDTLQTIRTVNNYHKELHYKALRKLRGPIASCIRGYLNTYIKFSSDCFYYCLAIDTQSPKFDHTRFGEPFHCYNYFARTAFVSAIAWSLQKYHNHMVNMRFYSDSKRRSAQDNFKIYVPSQVLNTIKTKRENKPAKYPQLNHLNAEIVVVDSDPLRVEPALQNECELIQLVDLITSNIAQAIRSSSGNKAKIDMAQNISEWIDDSRKPPWLQTKELHRRFSLSCFPDENGRFYDAGLRVKEKAQPRLNLNLEGDK